MNHLFERQIAEFLSPYSTDTEILEEIVSGIAERTELMPCKPAGNIAGPILQQYVWSDELMRKRFRKLLGTAMNPELSQFVHPAFVAIAAQMNDLDWDFMRTLRENVTLGVANCYLCKTQSIGGDFERQEIKDSSIKVLSRMTEFLPKDGDYVSIQTALDNLTRLQLIEIHMRSERKERAELAGDAYETIYMMYENLIEETVEGFRERFPKYHGGELRLSTGDIMMTAFGTRFVRACMI